MNYLLKTFEEFENFPQFRLLMSSPASMQNHEQKMLQTVGWARQETLYNSQKEFLRNCGGVQKMRTVMKKLNANCDEKIKCEL